MTSPTSLLWLRRDLRREDHPALAAAASDGAVLPLFVIDPLIWDRAPAVRQRRLLASLRALHHDLEGALVVRIGDPASVVPEVARRIGASAVHLTADTGPYGRRRDARVHAALATLGVSWVPTGTPYAVGPGRLLTRAGTPFQVFSPFRRAWVDHGWPAPAQAPEINWVRLPSDPLPVVEPGIGDETAGSDVARAAWARFRREALADYAQARDLPARPGTTRLSAALKFGEIHPRTLLADLAQADGDLAAGAAALRSELCWREFYADVAWHRPRSLHHSLRPAFAAMRHDDPATDPVAAQRWHAWRSGTTGYPFVDAGMRQLLAEGWMHNRVRMVTASFLVKHLHLPWQLGAAHFMDQLLDGDPASNAHGWQWVAGSGTDAAPYFRIFNPVGQGLRFDPDGDYVRRYVPELADLAGSRAHEPWRYPALGPGRGYPDPIVDLAVERSEALARLAQITNPDPTAADPTAADPTRAVRSD